MELPEHSVSTVDQSRVKRKRRLHKKSTVESKNASDSNNNNDALFEEFADTSQLLEQPQNLATKSKVELESPAHSEESPSITRSVQSQFSVALLRLQTDLDKISRRLADLETKAQRFSIGEVERSKRREPAQPMQTGKTLKILYLGWPIVVHLIMRLLERRSLSNKSTR